MTEPDWENELRQLVRLDKMLGSSDDSYKVCIASYSCRQNRLLTYPGNIRRMGHRSYTSPPRLPKLGQEHPLPHHPLPRPIQHRHSPSPLQPLQTRRNNLSTPSRYRHPPTSLRQTPRPLWHPHRPSTLHLHLHPVEPDIILHLPQSIPHPLSPERSP